MRIEVTGLERSAGIVVNGYTYRLLGVNRGDGGLAMGGWSKGKSSPAVLSLQIWPCLSRELGNFGRAHEKPYAKLAGARLLPEAKIWTCDVQYSTYLSNHEGIHFRWFLSISGSAHHQIDPDVTAFRPVLRNDFPSTPALAKM